MFKEDRIVEEGNTAELELDGTIYYVERDKNGNIVYRDPLPGKAVMSVLSIFIGEAIESFEKELEEKNK